MTNSISRRSFIRSGAVAAAATLAARPGDAIAAPPSSSARPSPVNLGLASYTFRNFTRAQLIGSMKQLDVSALNAKDTKDHLPMDPAAEDAAMADYKAAGI